MKLYDLLDGIEYKTNAQNIEISEVISDSRKIVPQSVFVCIKGEKFDGHSAADLALASGAAAVVCERDLGLENQIICDNTRAAYAVMCANYFGNPSRDMKMIGVTGTNGKTTVTNLIKSILTQAKLKVGLIGTIQNEIGDMVIHAERTTPDAFELQQLFSRMRDENCDVVVMEVSSHALAQNRVGGVHFDYAVFTNLTQDHLDYHKDMEDYFSAKKKLFEMSDAALVNIDDEYGKRIINETDCPEFLTYSAFDNSADFHAKDIECSASGVSFLLCNDVICSKIKFGMPGFYSVHNALAAAGVCLMAGVCLDKITGGLNSNKGVKGRSEIIPTGRDFTVICDYAHTPDGLLNILPSLKKYTGGRLITLFGCGGDRDKAKRPMMGEAAAENSDFLIVTSDNPRTEDPDKIIEDILVGVNKHSTEYDVVCDRRQAIFHAVEIARAGDVIVLAGKGHEDYQVLGDKTIHFDEREVVAEALEALDAKEQNSKNE